MEATIPAIRVSGAVTWMLDFDSVSESAGFIDCEYRREFDGLQFLHSPWLCPDCEVITAGEAVMTAGEDCYAQLSDDPPSGYEAWGFSADGGFYRSGTEQYPLWEPLASFEDGGEGADNALAWSAEYDLGGGAGLTLSASGSFRYLTDADTLLPESFPPRQTPYGCGWPRNDPGDLPLDFHLTGGGVFPNLRLTDQCGEDVNLWDLYGDWIVLDGTQPDCGPCQTMAAGGVDFLAGMRSEGVTVRMVSLMGGGLAAPWESPELETVTSWASSFGLSDPVLVDRGAAFALLPQVLGDDFGWPAWAIIDPHMQLVYAQVGFGTWDTAAEVILDLESRGLGAR